jgi:hypothetical protein
MTDSAANPLRALVDHALGRQATSRLFEAVIVDPALTTGSAGTATRGQFAMAINMVLFAGLLGRVPTGATYVRDAVARGEQIMLDHGALRTIDGPTGGLPAGIASFARLLEPLGYRVGGVYPLPRLRMTGRAFVHQDFPASIPQFFVSELHVDQLPEISLEIERVFAASTDPLRSAEFAVLAAFAQHGSVGIDQAQAALPGIVRAFGRHHETPMLADYEALLAHSAEAAWIATEGNAFNHATTRVPDVEALATRLKAAGFPLKDQVEVSANQRVRQTAFIADKVTRCFRLPDGTSTERNVPGSFYEFISRDIDPATGALDLTFDSGNATGIFSVTAAR